MRLVFASCLAGTLAVSGCGHGKANAPVPARVAADGNAYAPISSPPKNSLIVTPDRALVGKVVTVNSAGRFVVLNFPVGHLPQIDQQLNVYRLGLKVGEIKVTGPQRDDNIVGDLTAGDAAVGDVVQDR
jgi:hypothetical protein